MSMARARFTIAITVLAVVAALGTFVQMASVK
jgi:hypothetical protein